MQGKILLAISGVIAIILAFIFNPLKFPKDENGKTITQLVPKTVEVIKEVYINVPGKTVVDTKTIEKIRVIRDSGQVLIKMVVDTILAQALRENVSSLSHQAEILQAEKEALIEDRNPLRNHPDIN